MIRLRILALFLLITVWFIFRRGWLDARRPVSRVLSPPCGDGRPFLCDARYRAPDATNPGGGAGLPPDTVLPHPAAPIRSCSRWGLPCHPCCQGRGALLPHRFTLACSPKTAGGLFSVALSLGSPPPAVSRHRLPVEPWWPAPSPPALGPVTRTHGQFPAPLFPGLLSKMFFSEEKNQKTFTSPPLPRSRPWPGSFRGRRNKSLLLLFFRKEGLAS